MINFLSQKIEAYKFPILVFLTATLFVVWPYPGTIAIRQVLLILIFILSLSLTYRNFKFKTINSSVICLITLFLWIVLHCIFFSRDFELEYSQLTGAWIRIFISCLCGILLAKSIKQYMYSFYKRKLLMLVWLSYIAPPFLIIFFNLDQFKSLEIIDVGELWQKPYGDKHSTVLYGSILMAHSFATFQYFGYSKKIYQLIIAVIGILIYLGIFFLINSKNGFLIFTLGLILFLLFSLIVGNIKVRWISIFLAVSLLISPIIVKHYERNNSWKYLIFDAKIGYQIDLYPQWKKNNVEYPKNELGKQVSSTNYERVAWATAGFRLLLQNPLGYGLLRQSFGYLAEDEWPEIDVTKVKSTHSGWLDFSLATGILGIFLVFLSIIFSLKSAWVNRFSWWGMLGLWLLPIIFLAWTISELCTNHFVEMLFFILGFFAVINNKSNLIIDRRS